MGKIKPTLSLTANASGASSEPGPLSIALTLSATNTLDVTDVQSKIVSFASDTDHKVVYDGSTLSGTDTATETAAFGGFIYFKNTSSAANVYIGLDHDGGAATDIGAADDPNDGDLSAAKRLFTLKPGEFAWMPFDGTFDVIGDSSAAATLECWYFDRT
mgnify:CR=1 FL=1